MKLGLPDPRETEMFLKRVAEFRALPTEMPKDHIKSQIRSVLRENGPLITYGIKINLASGVDEEDLHETLGEMVEDGELEIRYRGAHRLYYFKG
jgi:hypothetical protein